MVDGPPAFHLCPRQEKGEKQMAKNSRYLCPPLLFKGAFLEVLHQNSLSYIIISKNMSHALSYCYGLDVCPSQNLYVESLTSNVMEFGMHTYEARLLLEEMNRGRKRGRLWPKPRRQDLMVLVCDVGCPDRRQIQGDTIFREFPAPSFNL